MTTRRVFAGGLLAAASATALRRRAVAQTLTKLTVAAIPSDISAEAFYALDRGFFQKAGFDASIVRLPNGSAISAAVFGGSADIGYANVTSVALAHARGIPSTILAPANMHVHEAPTAGIIAVKKTAPMQTARDLNGKVMATIGINNIGDIAGRLWIDKNGGDSSTVKFVELPFSEMKAALEAGRVDAAALDATADPLLNKPNDTLRVLGSAFDALGLRFVPSVWFTTSDWIAKHPAAAKAFVAAMRETAAWANAHHAESAAILATVTGQTPQQIDGITRVTYGDRLTPELIQPNIDAAARYGVLKAAFPASDLIANLG